MVVSGGGEHEGWNHGSDGDDAHCKMDEALKAFSDAIEVEPKNSAGYVNRGVVYTSQKNYEKAIADLNKAIELSSDSIPAHRFRAFAYLQMKEWKRAWKIKLIEERNLDWNDLYPTLFEVGSADPGPRPSPGNRGAPGYGVA